MSSNEFDEKKWEEIYDGLKNSKLSRRKFISIAASFAGGAALVACAPKTVEETAAPAVEAPKATEVPAVVEATEPPAEEIVQEIIMGIGTDVNIMDSRIMQPGPAKSQIMHVVEPISWPDESGQGIPILVKEWTPSTDPPGWTAKLQTNVTIHDGEKFSAEDVKYFFESVSDPANADWIHPDPISRLSKIKSVKVIDDETVFFETDGFWRIMPKAVYEWAMVPKKAGEAAGESFGVKPVGTGPYKFVEHVPGSHLKLEANPDYHGNWGKVMNSAVTFKYLTEPATRVAALEAGEVHIIDLVPPDSVPRLKDNPDLEVVAVPAARMQSINFHCGRAPFNDLNARLAVAYAVDVPLLVSEIMGGLTDVATAPFPPGTLGVAGETFAPFEYDLDKAKEYFDAAGLTAGTKIKVGGPVGRYINDKQVVQAYSAMMAEVGFDPEIEQLEMGTYWPKVTAGEYDVFYVGWSTLTFDPHDYGHVVTGWSDDNGGATHWLDNARVIELYQVLNTTTSAEEAETAAKEIAHLMWDQMPVYTLFYEPNIAAFNKKVKGWSPSKDTFVRLWSAYLEG